ncbi:hypothetical protein ABCR94_10405 [Streptomyces sp. 21So2-11]|uniref:hypothetical protein n=1 Tax=Streptomyces sp. 21So2-11 TaxID=3144408 RepID=UPI0032192978
MATIRVRTDIRDRLARVATEDLGGVTLDTALEVLLLQHHKAQILAAYDRLKNDPEAWAAYTAEQDEWDGTAGDGLTGDVWKSTQ